MWTPSKPIAEIGEAPRDGRSFILVGQDGSGVDCRFDSDRMLWCVGSDLEPSPDLLPFLGWREGEALETGWTDGSPPEGSGSFEVETIDSVRFTCSYMPMLGQMRWVTYMPDEGLIYIVPSMIRRWRRY